MAQQLGQTSPVTPVTSTPVMLLPSRSPNTPRAGLIFQNLGGTALSFGFSTGGNQTLMSINLGGGAVFNMNTESGLAGDIINNGDLWAYCPTGSTNVSVTEW
jgi:hypothetical protein